MKRKTAIKILKGYIRAISVVEAEGRAKGEPMAIIENYIVDRKAFEMAVKALEEKEE